MFTQKFNRSFNLFLFLFIVFWLQGQASVNDTAKGSSLLSTEEFKEFNKKSNNPATIFDSLKVLSRQTDQHVSPEYESAYYKYEINSLNYRQRVFEWQLASSKYIFIIVTIIVLLGLLLSFWQFYLPIYKMNKFAKSHKAHSVQSSPDEKDNPASTIKFGKDGIEITSSVIGLLILFLSIAFFFLYLKYVYPISEIP